MIKKTITYTNFADEVVTADFEFHISKAEFAKMELSAEGNSMTNYLRRISAARNGREIIQVMEMIVDKSYGVRTLDGKGFEKSPEHLTAFKASGAYDALFEELLTSDNAADLSAEFVRGLFPNDWAQQLPGDAAGVQKLLSEQSSGIPEGVRRPMDHQPKHVSAPEPTIKEVPFEGDVIESAAKPSRSIEELEAELEAARSAAQA